MPVVEIGSIQLSNLTIFLTAHCIYRNSFVDLRRKSVCSKTKGRIPFLISADLVLHHKETALEAVNTVLEFLVQQGIVPEEVRFAADISNREMVIFSKEIAKCSGDSWNESWLHKYYLKMPWRSRDALWMAKNVEVTEIKELNQNWIEELNLRRSPRSRPLRSVNSLSLLRRSRRSRRNWPRSSTKCSWIRSNCSGCR